ncbi:hypothetical protein [Parvularcula sp. IMCC14364]|uniref:hypothetical protein n=1 Tax=Parvularcula sp. IMCC14364 TaxID=3067902 RepID=UPI00274237BE|nr:hypothetical protein [Parvularcula sp. IMCC14364]
MRLDLLGRVRTNSGRERHILYYYRDRFAPLLLRWAFGDQISIKDVRQSPLRGLLEKPALKTALAACGKGILDLSKVDAAQMDYATLAYSLDFGQWPLPGDKLSRFDQTSRKGYSFVVQLNFTGQHDGFYRQRIDRENRQYFTYFNHPVNTEEGGRNTLAWARIDFDLETGEALIEELQNDWLRDAALDYKWAQSLRAKKKGTSPVLGGRTECSVDAETFCHYYEQYLLQHAKVWSEAMLAAALQVLVELLSIRQVWMHTFETGNHLKGLARDYSKPPMSLYKELPRKFCFQRTNRAPSFLESCGTRKRRQWLKNGNGTFWYLAL